MKLVLLGAPGAGKGTQAVFLKERKGLAHISTGDIFRHNLKNNTPLGIEAKKYMDAGQLVPDDVVMKMVAETLDGLGENQGFMLDGFPRTVAQAEFLEGRTKLDGVILFKIDDEAIQKIKRLEGLLLNGCKIGISCVILGFWDNKDGRDYLKKFVELKGADITCNPSWKNAGIVSIDTEDILLLFFLLFCNLFRNLLFSLWFIIFIH